MTRLARVLQKPPRVIAQRILSELSTQADRYQAPRRARRFDERALLASTGTTTVGELWKILSNCPYAVPVQQLAAVDYDTVCPGDRGRLLAAASDALARRVNLLGSGLVRLEAPIDWQTDFKTGRSWEPTFMRDIDYTNLAEPSDVKVPWELSRLQWLMPAGQAYLLTGDERYAAAVRSVLEEWIAANPYAATVNWSCTMEVALRIFSWTWFFHVFCRSRAWVDPKFQWRFLRALYLHGDFTERYLERSDINGNHFTADAAGLVFAGLFFGQGAAPQRWAKKGWDLLCTELPRQVFEDGVDFEGSNAYHRLVCELFFLPALFREVVGLPVPASYRNRVIAMARFTEAYSRLDGNSPLVGDADDARALPFGRQPITDHRYLAGMIGTHWEVPELMERFAGPREEIVWTLGPEAAALLSNVRATKVTPTSAAFPHGGFYVMRNDRDHVFIDAGPVGQAGRGGHGHNDCLSFEAVLDGIRLVSDCGAYVYTANARERNNFRSTAYHNTPQIDGEEINRFIRWDYLWALHNDAVPNVKHWETAAARDVFVGTHTGYRRLDNPVSPVRTVELDHEHHSLLIRDQILGKGEHTVAVPLHLAPGVAARVEAHGRVILNAAARSFELVWSSDEQWEFAIEPARVSPRYGVVETATRLVWRRAGSLPATLTVSIATPQPDRRTELHDDFAGVLT